MVRDTYPTVLSVEPIRSSTAPAAGSNSENSQCAAVTTKRGCTSTPVQRLRFGFSVQIDTAPGLTCASLPLTTALAGEAAIPASDNPIVDAIATTIRLTFPPVCGSE